MISGPLVIVVSAGIIVYQIGISGLIGILLVVVGSILNTFISIKMYSLRKEILILSD